MPVTYRIDRSARTPAAPPGLDDAQRRVVTHPGGPLLVLAGPGTGKTTTLVEAVVDRVENRGLSPDELLVLTFSRRGAQELRDRISARLGRTSSTLLSSTFHSLCYALLRRFQPPDLYADPLRLLSSPEQDVRLQQLLTGDGGDDADDPTAKWPMGLHGAVQTRGFAREIQAVLARAREKGLEPEDLSRLGELADRPEWVAVGSFMEEYLQVLDLQSALDYAELIHRAVLLSETPEVQAELRASFKAVFVDEYQDTDPSQVRLLQALAGDGRDLVVVGDPDQSIYAFRGAEVRGILEFPTQFPRDDGRPADVVPLTTTRRFGERLLIASRRIAAGIGMHGSIDTATFRAFRHPVAGPSEFGPGRAEVFTYSSSGAETDHIAELLRRAHLEDGIPWGQMAVLVRSGVRSIPGMRRALVAAGVPVEVAGDEVPLRAESAVQPLLVALRVAHDPESLSVEAANKLLASPLANLDPAGIRKLGRLLRRRDRTEHPDRMPRSSDELLHEALADPGFLLDIEDHRVTGPQALARLLRQTHLDLLDGATPEEALWTLWSGTPWPRRLRSAAEAGGAAARAANRDLDAVCALFDLAARMEEQRDHSGALVFLDEVEAQQIPADSLADRGVRGDAVRLLTAHRAKGLEWRLVVIAGVQHGSWPDIRRRGTLLQADRIGTAGLVEPPSTAAMLAEEKRLFYVAVTRARERLVVTAVKAPEGDGDQPSRLLDELGLPVTHVARRPGRPLSLPGLVSELRRVASDPAQREPLRAAAASRLAWLSDQRGADGTALVPAADPATWWGLRERTVAPTPIRAVADPLRLSPSALELLLQCPLRWFLSREAHGESARSTSVGFGSVLHALAEHMTHEGVEVDELVTLLDSVWDQLRFDSPWIAQREHVEAVEAIDRFVRWHQAPRGRRYVAAEAPFDAEIPLEGGERVRLRGQVDRIELDDDGGAVVIDFKTGKNPPTDKSVCTNPQLGLYQMAVDAGGFEELLGPDARAGGAELVHLRVDKGGLPKVQRQPVPTPDAAGRTPVEAQLIEGAATIRAEGFDGWAGDHCRICDFRSMCPSQQRSGGVL